MTTDLLFLFQRLHLLLVSDELLLHQQVVFDPLLLQQFQTTLSMRSDWKTNAGSTSLKNDNQICFIQPQNYAFPIIISFYSIMPRRMVHTVYKL